ncbi:alanine racemase [Croceibacterium ferulae]|uniref:alanine racemase n=1 Tax=Croceibacterium ferulae TaxID=1854641 RepID=UPI000EABE0A9|nr:alanine racemase [Croceibacterium ferulae]
MIQPPPAPLRLRIDPQALAGNWRALDAKSGAARAGAAVKADGYGLGAMHVVPVLRDAGVQDFFVAHWCEVPALLAHLPPGQIAVLHGPVTAEDAAYALGTGVRPVINSVQQARLWLGAGGGLCDLMVDTGMNRLGLPPSQLNEPDIARLQVHTLHSHLASADEDSAQNREQLALFRQVAGARSAGRRALANSAGIALGADYAFDLTRPGIALYGGTPRGELADEIRQVAFPQARILQVRQLDAGDRVGYNGVFTAPGPMRVATVALGYADGYLRAWGGRGVLHAGTDRLPLLGRVSMDMVVADLSAAPHLGPGDWLDVPYTLHDAAQASGLSQYELLTLLGPRLERFVAG